MDVDEHEVTENDANGGLRFLLQQFKERGHEFPHRLDVRRRVHRTLDVDRGVTVSGKIGGAQNARRHARAEQFAIPIGVVAVCDTSGVLPAQNLLDALLDRLKRLPVAARRGRVAVVLIDLVGVGIPVSAADFLDKGRADLIAFNGQRVIGIVDVNFFDLFQVRSRAFGTARSCRKDAQDLFPAGSSGREGMYQPFITALRNPALTSRSRCVRVMSLARSATRPAS